MKRLALLALLLSLGAVLIAQQPAGDELLIRGYGSLTSDDERSSGGGYQDSFSLTAPADGRVVIVAVSPDFAPVVAVRVGGGSRREGGGQGSATRLSARVAAGDAVTITVSGSPGDPGAKLDGVFADYMVVAHLVTSGTVLTVGGRSEGKLTRDDETGRDGEYIDWYDLPLPEDGRVRVAVSSTDFDTFLRAELPDGRELENDDADGTDSALSFAAEGGTARIGVTSFVYGATGTYEIRAELVRQRTIRIGEEVRDTLEAEENAYVMSGRPGETVSIELSSDEFDTYLELTDPTGTYLYNDDAGGISTSRIVYEFSAAGEATVTVSSFGEGGGRYNLRVRPYRFDEREIPDGYSLSNGEVITGTLGPHLPVVDGSYRQRLTFRAETDERVEMTLRSEDFDSYLTVVTPRGRELTDDDSAGGLDSRIVFVADETGVYEVYVSDLTGVSIGEYALSFRLIADSRVLLDTRGELTRDDRQDITGKHYDTYRFAVTAGRQVMIDVVSEDFDAYAVVRSRSGEILYSDDDSGGSSNARIMFTARESQTLELVVTSFTAEGRGRYTVRVYE